MRLRETANNQAGVTELPQFEPVLERALSFKPFLQQFAAQRLTVTFKPDFMCQMVSARQKRSSWRQTLKERLTVTCEVWSITVTSTKGKPSVSIDSI
jgi:hypothetical protein